MADKKYIVKITEWGLNLGLRIPKEIVKLHNFEDKEEVVIKATKTGLEIEKLNPESADNFVI